MEKLDVIKDNDLSQTKFNFEYAKLIDRTVEFVANNSKNLETIENFIEKLAEQESAIDAKITYSSYIDDLIKLYLVHFYECQDKIEQVHQTLIDLKNNILNTRLIGYETIKAEIEKSATVERKRLPFLKNNEILR